MFTGSTTVTFVPNFTSRTPAVLVRARTFRRGVDLVDYLDRLEAFVTVRGDYAALREHLDDVLIHVIVIRHRPLIVPVAVGRIPWWKIGDLRPIDSLILQLVQILPPNLHSPALGKNRQRP